MLVENTEIKKNPPMANFALDFNYLVFSLNYQTNRSLQNFYQASYNQNLIKNLEELVKGKFFLFFFFGKNVYVLKIILIYI